MYYFGTVLLNMSEEVFWRCTPRKLFSLMDVHVQLNTTEEQRAEKGIKGRHNDKRNNKEVVSEIASW